MQQNVFVYGTLLFPELVEKLLDRPVENAPAILRGYQRYQIWEREDMRMCPAIIQEAGGMVEGKVLFNLSEKDLEMLDFYEDDEYDQIDVDVRIGEEMRKASTYVWKSERKNALKGSWNPEDFEENFLSLYLEKIVPRYRQQFRLRS